MSHKTFSSSTLVAKDVMVKFQELAASVGLRVSGVFTGENSEGHTDVGVVELVPVV